MCKELNLRTYDGTISSFNKTTSQGEVKFERQSKDFTEDCFYGTSGMNSPRTGGHVSIAVSKSTQKVVFVLAKE